MQPSVSRLIYKRILGTLTDSERARLEEWTATHPTNAALADELTDMRRLGRERTLRRAIDSRRPAADMQRRINLMRARRAAAIIGCAAAICGVVWCAALLFRGGMSSTTPSPSALRAETVTIAIDSIRPGSVKAELITARGVSMPLDSCDSPSSPLPISRRLAANASPVTLRPEELCLDVPRGGEFKVMLSDSTIVWLNSESQLRFPEEFDAGERRVSLTGEAYFEVHPDPVRPFYVESAGQLVRVYGTKFDIKAYPDEQTVYTTLESGSISLRPLGGKGGELFLSPGQQALFDHADCGVEMKEVKTSVITGWRHGRFVFEEQTLDNIMRDLSRWYDFRYEFADTSLRDMVFLGSIPRYSDFRTAITILEKCGPIRFTADNDKIVISKR